jgi:hypothetical protein
VYPVWGTNSRRSATQRFVRCAWRLDVKTSKRYCRGMKTANKRATVYFDSEIHRGLRLKAAETDRSISDLVNDAVKLSLAEDAEDLAAFKERGHEPNLAF